MRSRPKFSLLQIVVGHFMAQQTFCGNEGGRQPHLMPPVQVSTRILYCSFFTHDLPMVSFTSDGSALTPLKGGPSDSHKGVSQNCPAQMGYRAPRLHSLEGLQTRT